MDLPRIFTGPDGSGVDGYRSYLAERGLELPADLAELLRSRDGGVANEDGLYAHIWSSAELANLNTGYAVEEFAPGLVLFGSDGGDEAFALCKDAAGRTVVAVVPFIGMSTDAMTVVGPGLKDLLGHLRR